MSADPMFEGVSGTRSAYELDPSSPSANQCTKVVDLDLGFATRGGRSDMGAFED